MRKKMSVRYGKPLVSRTNVRANPSCPIRPERRQRKPSCNFPTPPTECLRLKLLGIIHIDNRHDLMSPATGYLFDGMSHLSISYQSKFHTMNVFWYREQIYDIKTKSKALYARINRKTAHHLSSRNTCHSEVNVRNPYCYRLVGDSSLHAVLFRMTVLSFRARA